MKFLLSNPRIESQLCRAAFLIRMSTIVEWIKVKWELDESRWSEARIWTLINLEFNERSMGSELSEWKFPVCNRVKASFEVVFTFQSYTIYVVVYLLPITVTPWDARFWGNEKTRVAQNSCNLSCLIRQRQDHEKTVQLMVFTT